MDIIDLPKDEYNKLRKEIGKGTRYQFLKILDKCKEISDNKLASSNIIRYILYMFRNSIIKKIYNKKENNWLNKLYIKNENIPFDQMPFASSLYNHNPRIYDLLNCIDHK